MSPRSIVLLLAAFLFTTAFAIVTVPGADSSSRFGAPLGFASLSLWGGSFDPIAFIIDVLITALVMTGSWNLRGDAGVGICLAAATAISVLTVVAFLSGIRPILPLVEYSDYALRNYLALPALWAESLLIGTFAAFAARFVGRFRVII